MDVTEVGYARKVKCSGSCFCKTTTINMIDLHPLDVLVEGNDVEIVTQCMFVYFSNTVISQWADSHTNVNTLLRNKHYLSFFNMCSIGKKRNESRIIDNGESGVVYCSQ